MIHPGDDLHTHADGTTVVVIEDTHSGAGMPVDNIADLVLIDGVGLALLAKREVQVNLFLPVEMIVYLNGKRYPLGKSACLSLPHFHDYFPSSV